MIADLILITIMVLCIFLGYKKGLIKVAVRLLSFFIALIIALVLYTPISNYIIENTEIVPNLSDSIGAKIYNKEEKQESQENQANMTLTQTMEKYVDDYTEGVKENTSDFIANQIAVAVVKVGTWIGLFLIIKVLMIFLRLFGDVIAEIPILKQFNKAGGTIYGILEGIVIIYAVLAIINVASPMFKENVIYKGIEESHICKSMYENNILLKMIL